MKIAIIGAGICGLSAARFLSQRGHTVTLYEQFGLFHDRGSSHGASRIVRRAYSDPFYTACMAEAYPMWSDLEADSGQTLLHECGLLYFGASVAPNILSVADGLSQLQVPFEVLDRLQVTTLIPDLRLSNEEIAIWTPEAGWVEADTALRALFDLATDHGLKTVTHRIADPHQLSKDNDAVVVAAGSWTTRHTPLPVQVTLQTFAYVNATIEGPVWIEDSFDQPYGFPSDSRGQKIGVHRTGPTIDPDEAERTPHPESLEIIRNTAKSRFGIEDPAMSEAKTCLYTTTTTEDFLVGKLAPNVFFASACSGHGFKLGLWMGRLLSDFVEGKDNPQRHPRFYHECPV